MKVVTIVGARPQFIKAAVVSHAIKGHNQIVSDGIEKISEVIVHTGQHYDPNMSDIFFQEMNIPKPDYLFDINGVSHGVMTGRMLEEIESVLFQEKPEYVLVYGDTNSTLAGALAASKLNIPLVHVEAGLRSYNRRMPEEINRVVTDHVSSLLFCPTDTAVENLLSEGIVENVVQVGDVMLDATLYFKPFACAPKFNLPEKFVLATIHRAENTDNSDRTSDIFTAFHEIGSTTPVVLPLHPRTRAKLDDYGIDIAPAAIQIVEPVSYLNMLYLLEHCDAVLTDSGGLQKEACFFDKPCITLRDETEWVELVEAGVNCLAGADRKRIVSIWESIPWSNFSHGQWQVYGNGSAAGKVVSRMVNAK